MTRFECQIDGEGTEGAANQNPEGYEVGLVVAHDAPSGGYTVNTDHLLTQGYYTKNFFV